MPAPETSGRGISDTANDRSPVSIAEPPIGRQESAAAPSREPEDVRDDRDRIAWRAYEIYLERGGADGRDMDDWLEAERQLSGRRDR